MAPQFPRRVCLRSIKPGVFDISRNTGFGLPVCTGRGRRPGCGCPLVVRLRISNAHGALSTWSRVGACLGPGEVLRVGFRHSLEAKLLLTHQVQQDGAHHGHHYETGGRERSRPLEVPWEAPPLSRGPGGSEFSGSC